MSHISEITHPLQIKTKTVMTCDQLLRETNDLNQVCVIRLPHCRNAKEVDRPLSDVGNVISNLSEQLGPDATLIVIGEVIDLVQVQGRISPAVRYQHWVAIKREKPVIQGNGYLPNDHFGALIYTRYPQSLHHTKTRIEYTYCPVCNKTTKDYGGKKHIYHEVGTILSDVWRDVEFDFAGDLSALYHRFADLFGLGSYTDLNVFDMHGINLERTELKIRAWDNEESKLSDRQIDQILHGDCLEELRQLPSNSIDFAFTDPPYNLGKKYLGYGDALEIQDYFKWCDEWIWEMARVLKPGRTLALLNIPLWAVRHFLYLQTILKFQNWIVWDALAFPVRLIMPAHYTILCFAKGDPRALPGLVDKSQRAPLLSAPQSFDALKPLADAYCLRSNCVATRKFDHINDRTRLSDLWTDIHRLKHNSRRVDHPTQLPPHLMYRILEVFTSPGETILDCFNGSGTTTLTAQQVGRHYVGIEASKNYADLANARHVELLDGIDPFRKEERILKSKNSPVPRLPKQIYKVSKKTLQLEVKRIAGLLGHVPSREELKETTKYPIEYYDNYFISWGEVTAAARTTGMSENRSEKRIDDQSKVLQLQLLEPRQQYQTRKGRRKRTKKKGES